MSLKGTSLSNRGCMSEAECTYGYTYEKNKQRP